MEKILNLESLEYKNILLVTIKLESNKFYLFGHIFLANQTYMLGNNAPPPPRPITIIKSLIASALWLVS